jgi:glycerophosphoryl diester phosphodiesterase
MTTSASALFVLCAALSANPPEIVAHRGESADAPENTMAAFHLAWERKIPAIELDVHLSKDGKLGAPKPAGSWTEESLLLEASS